jgi:serine/threonine protein kinase
MPGELGDWLILKPIGSGGMGHVYLAVSRRDPSVQACAKIIQNGEGVDETALDALLNEGRLAQELGPHPNIVRIHAVGKLTNGAYILMDYIAGPSLLDKILASGLGIGPEECVYYALDMVDALEHVQECGYIHRDMNPSNIMLRDELSAILIDFGLCCPIEEALADRGKVVGTPLYVPPERCLKQGEDFHGEIYSLGMILFYALTGKPFFSPTEVDDVIRGVVRSLRTPTATKMPGIQPGLVKVVDRMIRREQAQRYASYAELRKDLMVVLSDLTKGKPATSIADTRRKRMQKPVGGG